MQVEGDFFLQKVVFALRFWGVMLLQILNSIK